jgi:hypothetical protein
MTPDSLPRLPVRAALDQLPRQQAAWILASALSAGGLSLAGMWGREPELALSLSIGCGAAVIRPRKLWAFPLVVSATALGGALAGALDLAPVLGAGLIAGACCAGLLLQHPDWLDAVNGALAVAAGSALGLWAAEHQSALTTASALHATAGAGLVALVASQGLVPLALRFDSPKVPSPGQIRRGLAPAYRAPVLRALELYRSATRHAPDLDSRRGLAEVTTWVFRLQTTLQTLDRELLTIDPVVVRQRMDACEADKAEDPFTRERRQATGAHLRRLLGHRDAIATEHQRAKSLVDYALAFLEDITAGLAVASELPGETAPERLPDVLDRLRSHSAASDARRRTAREVGRLQA